MKKSLISAALLTALFSAAAFAQDESCLGCHGQKDSGAPFAEHKNLKASAHGGLSCVSCHPGSAEYPHDKKEKGTSCSACHPKMGKAVAASGHGKAVAKTGKSACLPCHGGKGHEIQKAGAPGSATSKARQSASCGACHEELFKKGVSLFSPPSTYHDSVHGKALAGGKNQAAAACSDCHGSHTIETLSSQDALTSRKNVPETCGACHKEQLKDFKASLHGEQAARGRKEAPVCTDCHGEHDMKAPSDPASTVHPSNITKTCMRCHASARMASLYGIPADRVSTYGDSYHAQALRGGNLKAANCASCHKAHLTLPASDPRSSVHPSNMQATCRQCHKSAGNKMHVGKVHYDLSSWEAGSDLHGKILMAVRGLYILIIFGTIGFMLAHVLLDFQRKAISGFHKLASDAEEVRLSLNERIQHGLLVTTFFTLAYTGFCYVYPESFLRNLLFSGENGMHLRSFIHRLAALIFTLLAVYHVLWAFLSEEGKHKLRIFLPGVCDVRDFVHLQLYNVFGKKHPPQFGMITYMKKIEYWSLVWGSSVMIVTGLVLWFREWSLGIFPKWVVDLFILVHFMEALLACLAIGVWHSYWVVFDPAVYPMNWAWLTGRITLHKPRHRHHDCPPPAEKQKETPAPAVKAPAQPAENPKPAESPKPAEKPQQPAPKPEEKPGGEAK